MIFEAGRTADAVASYLLIPQRTSSPPHISPVLPTPSRNFEGNLGEG